MRVMLNDTVSILNTVSLCSINKSSGVAVQLKLKASALLQHVQDALHLPPLWPLVVQCCASTVRALIPKVGGGPIVYAVGPVLPLFAMLRIASRLTKALAYR